MSKGGGVTGGRGAGAGFIGSGLGIDRLGFDIRFTGEGNSFSGETCSSLFLKSDAGLDEKESDTSFGEGVGLKTGEAAGAGGGVCVVGFGIGVATGLMGTNGAGWALVCDHPGWNDEPPDGAPGTVGATGAGEIFVG